MSRTKYWIITFTHDKEHFLKAVVKGIEDLTEAYIEFIKLHPKECEIVDMLGVTI
jgi:hypothetical protein